MKTPDYAEAFIGWKGLVADQAGRLFSPRGDQWPPGEPLVAACSRSNTHTPPHPRCSCGIYALDTLETLREHRYNWQEPERGHQWVICEIYLWGDVRVGTIGFRTHLAYPKTVYVPAHLYKVGNVVRERYGINLRFIDRFSGERY